MTAKFFQKEPEKPKEPSKTAESKKEHVFLRKHLPKELFDKVEALGLLDGQEKTFTLTGPKGSETLYLQLKEVHKGPNSKIDGVELSLKGEEHYDMRIGEYVEDGQTSIYENKVLVGQVAIQQGTPYESGRKDIFPITGVSQKECEEITPDAVKNMVSILEQLQVKAQPSSAPGAGGPG